MFIFKTLIINKDELMGNLEENYKMINKKISSLERALETKIKEDFERKLEIWTEKISSLDSKVDQVRQ